MDFMEKLGLTYIYLCGILYILFILFLVKRRKGRAVEDNDEVSLYKSIKIRNFPSNYFQVCWMTKVYIEDIIYFTVILNFQDHASGAVRLGAILFGFFTVIYYGIEFLKKVTGPQHTDLDIKNTPIKAFNNLLAVFFCSLQAFTIFRYPNLIMIKWR